jgi:hypothetical protein
LGAITFGAFCWIEGYEETQNAIGIGIRELHFAYLPVIFCGGEALQKYNLDS